jgi:hypothetical protein
VERGRGEGRRARERVRSRPGTGMRGSCARMEQKSERNVSYSHSLLESNMRSALLPERVVGLFCDLPMSSHPN